MNADEQNLGLVPHEHSFRLCQRPQALADGTVYRTYITTARGLEPAMAYYGLLDRTPKGRDESATTPLWVCRHDEYETT